MAAQTPRPPVKFFTNHAVVLYWIAFNPESRVAEIAVTVGLSHRAAQAIVTDLAEGGFVIRRRVGRRNAYSIVPGQLLHPDHPDSRTRVEDLLAIVPEHHPWRLQAKIRGAAAGD
jgi:DNA-binding IclR family transcriptional regulator